MRRARAQPSSIRCSICNQTFGRQEHLTRHLRIHTQEKPYQCSLCQKRFSRLDVLNRHTASHEETDDTLASIVSSRACKQCANDRVRCFRGQPCRRCLERRLSCSYPTTRSVRSRANDIHVEESSLQLEGRVQAQGAAEQTIASFNDQTRNLEADRPAAATFPSVLGDPDTGMIGWTSSFGGTDSLYDFGQLGLGISGVNWLSPQYQNEVDWEALLAVSPNGHGLADTGYEMHNDRREFGHEGATPRVADLQVNPHQQLQQPPRTDPESDSIQSCSAIDSVASINSTERRYYVDGAGARAPFGGRSHERGSVSVFNLLRGNESDQAPSQYPVSQGAVDLCPRVAYDGLVATLMSENQIQSLNPDIGRLPSHLQVQIYVRSYFKNFHPIFPFVRRSSFMEAISTEQLLLLAVSAVGSRYVRRLEGTGPSGVLLNWLHTILQRRRYGYQLQGSNEHHDSLIDAGQHRIARTCPSLEMLQAGILNVICMLHSGEQALLERAFVERHYLVEACHSLRLITRTDEDQCVTSATNQDGHQPSPEWLKRESGIRTGMVIWHLDSVFLYEFDAKPLMDLDDIRTTLPSQDDAWDNLGLVEPSKKAVCDFTLWGALETVYMEKRLPPHLGEFSIGLLVNAIYRNTKRILAREQSQLNSWTPSATAQRRSEHISAQHAWLPTTPATSKWRNSACDCLDILHWPANSKVARLLGSEHHTILHLHLARLIILTPTMYIQSLAIGTASTQQQPSTAQSRTKYVTARHQVLQWVIRDRFKARLSVIHCGALYWHIRRYSCDSVLEPYAIYIATLVIWAFCVSTQRPEVIEATANDFDDEPEPHFLHLDRPLDDELVQRFVQVGNKMSAYISKVGNIYDRDAPAKVLQEGISLLTIGFRMVSSDQHQSLHSTEAPCYTWGIEESYVKTLRHLLHATTGVTEAAIP